MRDELDGRIWTAHHDRFSRDLDHAAAAVARAFNRAALRPAASRQLLVGLAALGMSLLTLGGSVA